MRFVFAILFFGMSCVYAQEAVMSFATDSERAKYYQLTHEIRCVVCQNQSIADSGAPLAKDMRRKVYEELHAGKSEGEIKRYLVERYGDSILFSPPMNTKTAALWVAPFLLLIGAIFVVFRRVV